MQKVISENQREPATHTNKTNIKRALKGGVHIRCPIRKRPKSRCARWCNHTERHRLTSASEEMSADSDAGGRRDQGMSPSVTGRPRDIQVFRHDNNPSCTHSTDSPIESRQHCEMYQDSPYLLKKIMKNCIVHDSTVHVIIKKKCGFSWSWKPWKNNYFLDCWNKLFFLFQCHVSRGK